MKKKDADDPEMKILENMFLVTGAEYPGGKDSLAAAMARFIKQPPGETCTIVEVEFVVEKDGSHTRHKARVNPPPACAAEALRFVRSMPPWSPGKKDDRVVRCRVIIPVSFKN